MQNRIENGQLTRRAMLTRVAALGAGLAAGATTLAPAPASARVSGTQIGWRFCNKCFGMIYIDTGAQNLCPRGGQHVAQGWTFKLAYNDSTTGGGENTNTQANWRRCHLCSVLFWTGTTSWTAGICPTGIQHDPFDSHNNISFQYLLPHDIGEPPWTQHQWRFCFKCSALFYNGYAYKNEYGLCPYDYTWGHTAAGYDFAIPVSAYTP